MPDDAEEYCFAGEYIRIVSITAGVNNNLTPFITFLFFWTRYLV
jgi:hypothetical protein